MDKASSSVKPEPLVISRLFSAPPKTLFNAWSTADHIKRWFSPEGCTVPQAEVDFHAGGVFAVCMRLPDGREHWMRCTFVEVLPPERLVFCGGVLVDGVVKFDVLTTVTFAAESSGTRLTVHQAFEIFEPAFATAASGARDGWRTTLDKLERETTPAATHGGFTLERIMAASPARVFHAFTDIEAKARWFQGGEAFTVLHREMDLRPGGREVLKGSWKNGMVSQFDAVYFDIMPQARLIYGYEMHLDSRKISVSLATIEMSPADAGTWLTITEHGVFLNGYEDNGARECGTSELLDRLAASLAD